MLTTIQLSSLLLCWMLNVDGLHGSLAAEVGVCHKTVLHNLHDILGYRKIAANWVPHTLSEVQQWQRYAICTRLVEPVPEGM